jgi:hypothetical protein
VEDIVGGEMGVSFVIFHSRGLVHS